MVNLTQNQVKGFKCIVVICQKDRHDLFNWKGEPTRGVIGTQKWRDLDLQLISCIPRLY